MWDNRHGAILSRIIAKFNSNSIRYFILRNYEGLPNVNLSKDVDIIVEPKGAKKAIEILKSVYSENGLKNYYQVQFGKVHCCYGMSFHDNISIHIDIISSYVSKGVELFSFDEMYSHTYDYKEFRVLNNFFEGVMIFIYKQFNYKPTLKKQYEDIIYDTHQNYLEFKDLISKLVGIKLTDKIFLQIEKRNFNKMLSYSNELTRSLTIYGYKKAPFKTLKQTIEFYFVKLERIVFSYTKYAKVISVMAPDGAGKTSFINALKGKIDFYFVNSKEDSRCNVYHFRPNILPNLGEVGEIIGVKKQNKDFTNPHRSKPANKFSSFFRITYYWLDYLIGFSLKVRRDVQFDRFSFFDRYSYDLIVDPQRTKLNLPIWLRKLFVKTMLHPKVVFYLKASAEVIYKRKQELSLDEIERQNFLYDKIANSNNRFFVLDSNRPIDKSIDDAIKIILEQFTVKL